MKMSPFSAPVFWGTQKRGLLLPKQAAALWEGPTLVCDLNHRLASSEASVGRNVALREIRSVPQKNLNECELRALLFGA